MIDLNKMVDEIFLQEGHVTSRDNSKTIMVYLDEDKQEFKRPKRVRKMHRNKYDKTMQEMVKSVGFDASVKMAVTKIVLEA